MRFVFATTVCAVALALAVPELSRMTGAVETTDPAQATGRSTAPPRPSGGPRYGDEVFRADAQGHYRIDARVGSRRIAMLADTGATVVALRRSDADRIGLRTVPADYDRPINTANGVVKGASVTIPELTIGSIRVDRVEAVVLPDEALGVNLLGMSFLKRLKRFEMAGGDLVLTQ